MKIKVTENEIGRLNKPCSIEKYKETMVGSAACIECENFIKADDSGDPKWIKCKEWRT